MIAVDTNILVYGYRAEVEFHARAKARLDELAAGDETWTIPWPCVHEFIGVVTNPRLWKNHAPAAHAFVHLRALMAAPAFMSIVEQPGHLGTLASLVESANLRGPAIHDARIAAICLDNGVRELWSVDRDFSRFPQLRTRNPLVEPA